jgi:hypothetical protein
MRYRHKRIHRSIHRPHDAVVSVLDINICPRAEEQRELRRFRTDFFVFICQ